jgi:hypothetical protein
MSNQRKGIRLKLSPARRFVIELMHHARRIPSIPVSRSMNVAALAAARRLVTPAPSWTAIFMRAYGLVCRDNPELRRALVPWPRPHLYEHPHSVAGLVVEREWQGEPVLLGTQIRAPENRTVDALHREIRRYKEVPVESIGYFRQALRVGRMPWLWRRFLFWHSLYLSGYKRAKRFGTFMLSSYGSLGAEQIHPLSVLTTLLTFGPISPSGDVIAKIIYDHRVMDGRRVAQCLNDLEHVLNTELVAELRTLADRPREATDEDAGTRLTADEHVTASASLVP